MNFDFLNNNENTLKTDNLEIKENAISMNNNTIQIHNISMMSKSELVFQLSIKETIILLIAFSLLFFEFIPKLPPLLILIFCGYFIYNRYTKHMKEKYYIEFNLGSSKNYYLFFENNDFRNQVYEVIVSAFSDSGKSTKIDIKNQNINNGSGSQEIVNDKTINRTTVAGNDNFVGSDFGQGNTIAIKGDAISGSNVAKDSIISNSNFEQKIIPWEIIISDLKSIVEENNFSAEINEVFTQLLAASEEKDNLNFNKTITDNAPLFDKAFIKAAMSATLANIISGILF